MFRRNANRKVWQRGPDEWRDRHIVICNWRDASHPDAGGAEQYCEKVATRYRDLHAHVTLLTARYPGSRRRSHALFGDIRRVGGTYTVYPLALIWLFLHRRHIDAVIDSQNGIPFFSPLVVGRRTPVALLIHHVHQEQFALYFPRPLVLVGRLLENQVSALIYGERPICVVSPSSRSDVRQKLSFQGPVFVVPCGQDLPSELSRTSRTTTPTVIYVGRLVRQKRLEKLLVSFRQVLTSLPEAKLHLVGDGEARDFLVGLSDQLGLADHVTFEGRVADRVRDELLAASWLFVTTSRAEGWGMSVMEAAASGVPALSFRVPGLRDAIDNGTTGWLIGEGDDLALAMCSALGSLAEGEFAERIAAQCRARAQRFSWTSTADRLLGVLASEQERRTHVLLDRRRVSDVSSVVTMGRGDFSLELLRRLRRQDEARFGTSAVELLLIAADEEGAVKALERVGLPLAKVQSIRVARAADLIGWDFDAAGARLDALEDLEPLFEADPLFGSLVRSTPPRRTKAR